MTTRGGYPCPHCPETFVVPSLLEQHLTETHPDRKDTP